MSCVFSIAGDDLDVDRFVEETGIIGFRKRYKGDLISPSRDKKLTFSYATMVVSDADFSSIKTQIEETEAFLSTYKDNLKYIAATKEINDAKINFGVDSATPNGMVKSFYFPQTLIAICAELKIEIEVSIFAV